MALRDFFFTRRSSDASSEAASPLDKPTFTESFFGYGKAVHERDIQLKRISKEYHAQKNDFFKDSRSQQRDLEKSLAKQKERYFHKQGYADLADAKRLTKEQLRDLNLKEVAGKFERIEERTRRDFTKRQREGLKQLQKNRDAQRHAIFQRTHHPDRPTGTAA
jgi:hypothetical protein